VQTTIVDFQHGVHLALENRLLEAIQAFKHVVDSNPVGDLADDALANLGLCYMRINSFNNAIDCFTRVVTEYPDAKIAVAARAQEVGRTAAKALLGRMRCRLAQGDREQAKADLERLTAFSDSYVIDAQGKRRSFHELGREAIACVPPS